jgi:acetate kinase
MSDTVLVVNAGSSSIKFQLFAIGAGDRLQRRLKGQIEGIGVRPHLIAKGTKGDVLIDKTWPAAEAADVPAALGKVVEFPSRRDRSAAHRGRPPRGAWRARLQRADSDRCFRGRAA